MSDEQLEPDRITKVRPSQTGHDIIVSKFDFVHFWPFQKNRKSFNYSSTDAGCDKRAMVCRT